MDNISYTQTRFLLIVFCDEEDNELMVLHGGYNPDGRGMRVPNIGERIILASYAGEHVNDRNALFRNFYKVVGVITHYSENKRWKNITVQYSVILRKEGENKLKKCLVRFLEEYKKALGLDKLKCYIIKIFDALTKKRRQKGKNLTSIYEKAFEFLQR